MTTEIATLPPQETALQVYSAPSGLDPYIEQIRKEALSHVPDTSTKKGRDHIASIAFKVRKSKTAMDNLGKQLVDELKEAPKKVDAERKRMRESLDALADEVRKPLDEWEAAEQARTSALRSSVERLRDLAACLDGLDSAALNERLAKATDTALGDQWQEYETEAARAKDHAIATLIAARDARLKYEAEQAELARLRAEALARAKKDDEERIAREATERATREAEAKAQAEREAVAKREADAKAESERRELELKLQAEQAEKAAAKEKSDRLAAEQRAEHERLAAIEAQKQAEARAEAEKLAAEQRAKDAAEAARLAEIKRQADEKAAAEAEQKRRADDLEHKKAINNAALEAFVAGGMPMDCAKQAIRLIAKGEIPAVRIHY